MAQDMQILLQNYQGTFILDMLNEFRKDVIRCMFRDMVIAIDSIHTSPPLENHSRELSAFLRNSDCLAWANSFSEWFGADCPAHVKSLYVNLQLAAREFIVKFNSKPKTEIWAYLYSPQFATKLRISAGDKQGYRGDSLAGLFNVVALSIDKKNVKLIQPHDIELTGGFHTLQCCFPILNATARSQLAKDFEEEQEFISLPLEEDFSIKPAIFRGHTAVCYDTGYYQHHVGSLSLLPKARRVYNTCFLQIRPQADLQKANGPVGFIQLQCCLPGLMNFLVPKSTSKDTDVLVLGIDKQLVATKGCEDNFKDVVLAEFANDWWESDKERRSLCTFWRLRELTHGWPRRLYNILDLGKRQAAILEKELVRREQHKYRQQLQLLDQPIDDLLSAVGLLQESSSQVYAIVREPSDAIFGIHHQVAPLFDENSGKLVVASDFSARIQHDPMEYDEKEEVDIKSLRSVVAMLLLKWTGYHKKTTTLTYLQFMTKASQWLDKCERDGKAYHWLLSQIRGVLLRPAPNATTPPQVDRMSDLLGTGYPFAALQQGACAAKSLLFTPFKLGASELGVLPVAIAAKLDHKKTFDIDRGEVIKATISDVAAVEEHLTLTRDISPALPKDIIQFIHGVVGEAFNRRQSLNVDALQIKRWYYEDRDINWQHIRITFSDSYLKGALKKLRGEVDSLLRADRDWRIEFGASGNFSAPFKTLANRLLGVGSEWFVSPTLEESDVFRLMNATSHNTFAVSSHDRCICLEWQKK